MTPLAPELGAQRRFWNDWNTAHREVGVDAVCQRQAAVVSRWLSETGRRDLDILEVGCGTGWLCPQLRRFGQVTATDLSDEVLARAQARLPDVVFVAGDFMTLNFGEAAFDVITTFEVLSHVSDQPAFLSKLAWHLRPGGELMLATQNRPVLERLNRVAPPDPGQVRKWVNSSELETLLSTHFEVLELFSVFPRANRGILRVLNSRTFNRPVRMIFGNQIDQIKEAFGLGWTLMARARRRNVLSAVW
jgi:2-polyprenyl-3-methyl-5-hydroxy-6-metoxy-1,4-benzoquinol methylase